MALQGSTSRYYLKHNQVSQPSSSSSSPPPPPSSSFSSFRTTTFDSLHITFLKTLVMDVRLIHPTGSWGRDHYELYPTSPKTHYIHLIIAIILTTLHLTPLIITSSEDHNAIIFAQPYLTKWLMIPYAVFYTVASHIILVDSSFSGRDAVKCLDGSGSTQVLITEPRTIILNLRMGQLTYLLSGGVLMWDVPYLWVTYLVPTMWNTLPPYSFGDPVLELDYLIVVVGLMVSLLLGPVLVVVLIVWPGWSLRGELRLVERSCWERLELKERALEGKNEL